MSTTFDTEGADELARAYALAFAPFDGLLDAATLLAEAQNATGLRDWGGEQMGEPGFRERFGSLCFALEHEAMLSGLGRTRARSRLHWMLVSRLRTIAYARQLPALPGITAPLIGTGMPRTGTSFLQALLAQDPENLAPVTAQAMAPVPPPGVLANEADRNAIVERLIAFQGLDQPRVHAVHPIFADAVDEDVILQEAACGGLIQAFFNLPSFAPVAHAGYGDMLDWQNLLMRLIQSHQTRRRWVLKAPEYLGQLDQVLARYPDGKVFVNHRDPAKVIASIASLCVIFQGMNSDVAVPPELLGQAMLQAQVRATEAHHAWRVAHPEIQVVDIHYRELVSDPIGQAERLYAAFDLPMSAAVRQRMTDYLEVNRHGQAATGIRHTYALADFGLTEGMIEAALGAYMTRYDIAPEVRA